MNIQNNNGPLPSDPASLDRKFRWGRAFFGFLLGLVSGVSILVLIGLLLAPELSEVEPSASAVIVTLVVFAGAMISPFVLGCWFGKIGWSNDQFFRRNATIGLKFPRGLWYGTRGRMNRQGLLAFMVAYLVALTFVSIALGLAMALSQADVPWYSDAIIWPLVIVTYGVTISPFVRRLHDLGSSGWPVMFLWIPVTNLFILIPLFIAPGNNRPNKYGPQSQMTEVTSTMLRQTEAGSLDGQGEPIRPKQAAQPSGPPCTRPSHPKARSGRRLDRLQPPAGRPVVRRRGFRRNRQRLSIRRHGLCQ